MFVLCVGCTLVFATTTGINLCVMLAVPDANRSVAIAVNSVFIHAFGDVPSPVVAGLLKDTLAPACNANGDDDTVISSDGCRANSNGLRLCMLLITLWLAWSIFFFSLVWRFSGTRSETLNHLDEEAKARADKKNGSDEHGNESNVNESLLATDEVRSDSANRL